SSHPEKQRLTELVFEEQNLPADRRLRHVQLAPAGGERSRFRDRLENFQLTEIHGASILSDDSEPRRSTQNSPNPQRKPVLFCYGAHEPEHPSFLLHFLPGRHETTKKPLGWSAFFVTSWLHFWWVHFAGSA